MCLFTLVPVLKYKELVEIFDVEILAGAAAKKSQDLAPLNFTSIITFSTCTTLCTTEVLLVQGLFLGSAFNTNLQHRRFIFLWHIIGPILLLLLLIFTRHLIA